MKYKGKKARKKGFLFLTPTPFFRDSGTTFLENFSTSSSSRKSTFSTPLSSQEERQEEGRGNKRVLKEERKEGFFFSFREDLMH